MQLSIKFVSSKSVFLLNDIFPNEILKNPKQLKQFKIIKYNQVNYMFFRNKTAEISMDYTKCRFVIYRCFETITGSGN